MDNSKHLSYGYLIAPLITLLLVLPPISELPPFLPEATHNPNLFQVLLVVPFYLGLMAAPGYIYAWLKKGNIGPKRSWQYRWAQISLFGAIIASMIGAVWSIPTVIIVPFALWSLVVAIKLLQLFRRQERPLLS